MANLTSKELTAIEDQLSAEQLLITKYRSAAGSINDPELKSVLERAASKHQEHYSRLLSHLN